MKKLLTVLFFYGSFCSAQDMVGTIGSNYQSASNKLINPATMSHAFLKWDLNIIGLNGFLDNNGVYVSGMGLIDFTRPDAEFSLEDDLVIQTERPKRQSAHILANVQALSFMLKIKKHAFGFHTATRFGFNISRYSLELTRFAYENIINDRIYIPAELEIPKFKINTLAWSEVGISHSRTLYEDNQYKLFSGITVKRILGLGGLYFVNKELELEVDLFNPSEIGLGSLEWRGGYGPNEFTEPQSAFDIFQGRGWAIDIGVVYEKREPEKKKTGFYLRDTKAYRENRKTKKRVNYEWRVGASLVDLGYVNFRREGTRFRVQLSQQSVTNNLDTTLQGNNNEEGVSAIAEEILSEVAQINPEDFIEDKNLVMHLPRAISLQVDYKLKDRLFVNASFYHKIFATNNTLERPTILSVTPRFETRMFELALPLLVYQYRYPRLGLSVRLPMLFPLTEMVIGTDNLGSIVGLNLNGKLTGSSIFFILKATSFRFNLYKIHKKSDPRMAKTNEGKRLSCPDW